MREDEILDEAVRRIRAEFAPISIILFGSRARGEAHAGSDYDLMVIREDAGTWRTPGEILTALRGLPAEFDVLVDSAAEWEKWRKFRPAVQYKIALEGKELFHAS